MNRSKVNSRAKIKGSAGASLGGDRRPLLGRVAHAGHDLEADGAPGGKSAVVDEHSVEHLGIHSPGLAQVPSRERGQSLVITICSGALED